MAQRTKEERAAYMREYRERRKAREVAEADATIRAVEEAFEAPTPQDEERVEFMRDYEITENVPNTVQIGDRVRHRVNGYQGIITGSTSYINGCRQHLVVPEGLDKDGAVRDGIWIDEQHLILINHAVFENPFATSALATAGGPDRYDRATQ